MLKAILFDIGGTLFDSAKFNSREMFECAGRSTYELLESHGHRLPDFESYFSAHAWIVRWAYVRSIFLRRDFNCFDLLRTSCHRMNVPADEPTLRELAWKWYEPMTRSSSVADDVLPTLRNLQKHGYRLGLISNTFIPGFVLDRHLDLHGLLEFFPVRIYSSDTGHRKPGRAIFAKALRAVDVNPSEAIYIGDKLWNDIFGARRAGMRTILRNPRSNATSHLLANHVVRRISEIQAILPAFADSTADLPAEELAYEA